MVFYRYCIENIVTTVMIETAFCRQQLYIGYMKEFDANFLFLKKPTLFLNFVSIRKSIRTFI